MFSLILKLEVRLFDQPNLSSKGKCSTAGVFTRLGEEAVFATIAHESGHYYRAHSIGSSNTDQYFYEEKSRERPVRPPRLQDLILKEHFDRLVAAGRNETDFKRAG
jgi:hypothetical protein